GARDLGQGGIRRELRELARNPGGEHVAFGAPYEQAGLAEPSGGLCKALGEMGLVSDHLAGQGQDLWIPVPAPASAVASEVVAQPCRVLGPCAVRKVRGDGVGRLGETRKA